MKKDIFDINKFNVIQDEENYYLFRALNMDDQREIIEGINSENGNMQRVITNKKDILKKINTQMIQKYH